MSRILENSNTNEVGDLNYVVIGNLKIAAILKFPLAAYHTIQHLVKQLNLLISDQALRIVSEAKQLPQQCFLTILDCRPFIKFAFLNNTYTSSKSKPQHSNEYSLVCYSFRQIPWSSLLRLLKEPIALVLVPATLPPILIDRFYEI
jgi:hypothetical protein